MLGNDRARSISRRDLARVAATMGVTLGAMPLATRAAFAQAAQAALKPEDVIAGISPEMIVFNAKILVMETPLTLLRKFKHTPKEILFTRFHFPHEGQPDFATVAPPSPTEVNDWTIHFDGMIERPRTLHLEDIAKRPQVTRVSVLQCAGNGRGYYAALQKTPGSQWKNGGMGNVEWEGAELRPLLADLHLMPGPSARWLTAQPWIKDQPATPQGSGFAKSYPLTAPALDHAILALKMNGEPIPAVHGGPVRLIIPGYYGNMNVKMVRFLLLMPQQSPSAYQSIGYRMPLKPVKPGQFGFAEFNIHNSTPTYGHAIKSVIFSPLASDKPKNGSVTITGVAFNDGLAPITRVEVTTDGGTTWQAASLAAEESPWAWRHFSLATTLPAGSHVLASRATDSIGRTQPLDGLARWNPRGFEWNGVEKLSVAFS